MKNYLNINFKKLKQFKPEVAILLTGIVLMLIGGIIRPGGGEDESKDTGAAPQAHSEYGSGNAQSTQSYAEYYARQIEGLLESMDGISRAKAAVYVKNEGSGVLAENFTQDNSVTNETDSQGGSREEHKNVSEKDIVILKDSQGNESVVYLSQSKPEIAGIAVTVKGASGLSKTLEEKIKLALMALYDVPASKISITG